MSFTNLKLAVLVSMMTATVFGGMAGQRSGDGTQWKYIPKDTAFATNAVVPPSQSAGGCPEGATGTQQSNCQAIMPACNAPGTQPYYILFGNKSLDAGQIGIWFDPSTVACQTQSIWLQAGVSLFLMGTSTASYPGLTINIIGGNANRPTRIFYQSTGITVGTTYTFGINNVIASTLASVGPARRDAEEDELAHTYGFTVTNAILGTGAGPSRSMMEAMNGDGEEAFYRRAAGHDARMVTGASVGQPNPTTPPTSAPAPTVSAESVAWSTGMVQVIVLGQGFYSFGSSNVNVAPGSTVEPSNPSSSQVYAYNSDADGTVGCDPNAGGGAGTATFGGSLYIKGRGAPSGCSPSGGYSASCHIAQCTYTHA